MAFFDVTDPTDKTYRLLQAADWEPAVTARSHVESLWHRAAPYLDPNLPEKAATNLHPHYWELLTATGLLDGGIELVPRSDRFGTDFGPDILCKQPKCWIEAIAPTGGTGPDAISPPPLSGVTWVPHHKIKLRLTSALSTKLTAYEEYVAGGLLPSTDPYVIAVNGGGIPYGRLEKTLPHIVSAVFPFGDEYVTLDRDSLEVTGAGYRYAPTVAKERGAEVRMDAFISEEFVGISAILYSTADALNHPVGRLADSFILVHNPLAANPLPRRSLPCRREYWADVGTSSVHWE
jgi:hypothetical protein